MEKLTVFEINKELETLLDWDYLEDALQTDFEFNSFKDCISAITRIAFECEALNHHPEWTNNNNTLDIKLTTHSAGGVTKLDIKLARIINKIIEVED